MKPTFKYLRRLRTSPPRSSFKSLLIVTSLLDKANKMSLIQQIPEGLKPQEVERGSGRLDPPIPYVPEKTDELDPDRKVPTIKVELSNGVESRIVLWDGIGTSEQFLSHMMAVREGLEGMGLFKKYEEAEAKVGEMRKQLKKAKDQKELTLREIDESALEADKAMFRFCRARRAPRSSSRELVSLGCADVACVRFLYWRVPPSTACRQV